MRRWIAVGLTLALLVGTLSLLSACGGRITYENSESYQTGTLWTEGEIKGVEIYWEGREVRVTGAFSTMISVKEDYTEKDEKALRYSFENGILKIYPCASGTRLGDLSKTLFVELPYAQAYALDYVNIVAVGDTAVDVQLLRPKTLSLTAEDGDISFDGLFGDGKFATKSGNLHVSGVGCDSFDFVSDTGSANISLHLQGFTAVMRGGEGFFTTTYDAHQNGNIYTYGTQTPLLLFTTSGNVRLSDEEIMS